MTDPFKNRAPDAAGPATDIVPVTPADGTDLATVCQALYVETAGIVSFVSAAGQTRTVKVADYSILPVRVRRVRATGTTATGIHALVLA